MNELSFNFKLLIANYNKKKKRQVSNLEINAEWSLVCLWSNIDEVFATKGYNRSSAEIFASHPQYVSPLSSRRPEFLEIRRTSPTDEILVSGTLKLMRNGECVLQRQFKQLFEADAPSTLMELEFSSNDRFDPSLGRNVFYSISGTLEYAKGDQFRSLQQLSSDFELLLDPKETSFSDVNLKCGTDSFSAHKNILCARSPVLAAMFTTEMRESRDNKVDIADLSPLVLKTMLTYIYTGKTGELSAQSAGELLFAADKYQLQDLKRVCIDYLKSCMSIQNVLLTLVLGDLHDEDLKRFAMGFVCNRCEEFEILEKTEEWKNLREKKPSIAMDVLTGLVKSLGEKWKRRT